MEVAIGAIAVVVLWIVMGLAVFLLYHYRWRKHAASEDDARTRGPIENNDAYRDDPQRSPRG